MFRLYCELENNKKKMLIENVEVILHFKKYNSELHLISKLNSEIKNVLNIKYTAKMYNSLIFFSLRKECG